MQTGNVNVAHSFGSHSSTYTANVSLLNLSSKRKRQFTSEHQAYTARQFVYPYTMVKKTDMFRDKYVLLRDELRILGTAKYILFFWFVFVVLFPRVFFTKMFGNKMCLFVCLQLEPVNLPTEKQHVSECPF